MDVIYHHRVIKTDMLLEDVVYRLILKYLKEKAREESSGFDRRITVATPDDISGLGRRSREPRGRREPKSLLNGTIPGSWCF